MSQSAEILVTVIAIIAISVAFAWLVGGWKDLPDDYDGP